ncbi:MAG: hypothetical protein COA79_09770 [Planctomycetota bacterium]|nr:MAG: hypothetical protein COA79_09770 [Planctomycetota bacterium]
MSRLYIFNFKLESYLSLISLVGISLFSCAWLIRFIVYPDPRIKLIGFTILGLGIILPLLTFKLSKEWRLKISMSMLGTCFGLYGFEYFLEIQERHFQTSKVIKKENVISTFDRLTNEGQNPSIPIATLSLVKRLNSNLDGSIPTEEGSLLPISNASRQNILLCEEPNGPVIFQSDRFGFNNRDDIWDSHNIDIAFLGDSFVEGICVQREKNITGKVIEKYPNVLNLGIVGHGPLAMLATIKEYLILKKPKIVVWCFVSNDLYPNLALEKGNKIFLNYLKKDFTQNLYKRQNEIDLLIKKYIDLSRNKSSSKRFTSAPAPTTSYKQKIKGMANSKFTKLYRLRQKVFRPYLAKFNSDLALFDQIMTEAKRTVESWSGEIIFVYLPTAERFYKRQLNPFKNDLQKLIQDKKIKFIDLENEFLMDGNPKRFFKNAHSHYNENGYAFASEAILKSIQSRNQ